MRNIITVPLAENNAVSMRKGIIGGSDIATILGFESFDSKYQLALKYNGHRPTVSREDQKIFDIGHAAEKYIADRFEIETGLRVAEPDYFFCAEEDAGLVAHIDREIVSSVGGKRCALECKHVNFFSARKEDSGWGEPGTAEVPPRVYAQCLWYCELGGYDMVFVARLTGDELFIYRINSNEEEQKKMFKKVLAFKRKLDSGLMPAPKTKDDIKIAYPKAAVGKKYVADEKILKLFNTYKRAKDAEDKAKKRAEDYGTRIKELLQDCELVVNDDDKVIATYKTQESLRIDEKKIKSEFQVCEDFTNRINKTLAEGFELYDENNNQVSLPEGHSFHASVPKENVQKMFADWEDVYGKKQSTRILKLK